MEDNNIKTDNTLQITDNEEVQPKQDPEKVKNKKLVKELTDLISENESSNQSEEKATNILLSYIKDNKINIVNVYDVSNCTLAHKYCSERKYFHLKVLLSSLEKLLEGKEQLNSYLLHEDVTHMNIFETSSELGEYQIFKILTKYLEFNPKLISSIVSQEKNNIFHIAATENKIISLLFYYDFYKNDPFIFNKHNKSSWSPLHLACYKGNYEFVQSLVNLGADINFVDKDNKNALFYAVESGDIRVVKYLILTGINKNQLDKSNKKAIDYNTKKEINLVLSDKTLIDTMIKCETNYQSLKGHHEHIILLILLGLITLIQIIIALRKSSIINCFKLNFTPDLIILVIDIIFEILCISLYVFVAIKSYLKNSLISNNLIDEEKLYELYNNNPSLCVKCKKVMASDTQHCIACDKCIEHWDHHCFWLNTCIEKSNKIYFDIFLMQLLIIILSNLFTIIFFFVDLVKYPAFFIQIFSNKCVENSFGLLSIICLILILASLVLDLFFFFGSFLPYLLDFIKEKSVIKKVDAFTDTTGESGKTTTLLYSEENNNNP